MSNDGSNLLFWLAFLSINELAVRDGLTGLHNRRYFEETLQDHIEVAGRYGHDLSLALFDIDDFKQINDTLGHDAGDRVLRHFAALLKKTARKADIVCRFGGDEFAVILPETNRASAEKFTERILHSTDLKSVEPGQDDHAVSYSVSAGITALPCENPVAEADADLLRKKRGRHSLHRKQY